MFLQLANKYLNPNLSGRYITNSHIEPELKSLKNDFKIITEGKSVQDRNVYSVQVGTGNTKVLIWSQMHGNESTTTKGLFDFFNFLNSEDELALKIKEKYTLLCIPILNPDGAFVNTRVNANDIDLNRDAFDVTQPESKLLRALYIKFNPDYCYNLHDQRTIFGTEGSKLPATMSFLAPSYNVECDFNETRFKAIKIINRINKELQSVIPNQIGRFDDAFNINCVGDYFTSQGTPTVLFEAGHYANDYQRDEVRKFVFISLISSFLDVEKSSGFDNEINEYLNISQNSKCFFDFIYRNVRIIENSEEKIINFAAQFKEELVGDNVDFVAEIIQIDSLEYSFGHIEYDCKGMIFSSSYGNLPKIQEKANFYLNNLLKYSNGLLIL
ncbi:M14 metallopeptidase family protein [Flavobacterium sp.]|jgi:hypothetical protein|uniref:M14 family metallopeptidase n=1 Tax=Flavobacterium sp. TaxID=239 RepID=UPI002A831ACC|nr:M14 metallopeptidase family protein [Flavobacterium sp.]